MLHVLEHALIDTLKIFPFLIIAYILIEVFTYFLSDKLNNGILSKWAPLFGGLLGTIPQCGFGVVSAELYTRRFITIGTLFAVFIATSDEAILVLIASPEGLKALIPVILIKLVLAIVVGVLLDVIFAKRNKRLMEKADEELEEELEDCEDVQACSCCACKPESKWEIFLLNPLIHSLKILAFIFAVNIVFGTIIHFVGEDNVVNFLQSSSAFGPLISALVGLIPNCASSVIISQLYVLGGLNFASLVAGLCANVGVASLVLFRKIKIKEAILIIVSLFAISIAIGYLLMLFNISF
ncbi:MAG: arsenic efflux protein [Clostridia bacterium]|nr:arsenic efflux protein [Clostridia bacterium]